MTTVPIPQIPDRPSKHIENRQTLGQLLERPDIWRARDQRNLRLHTPLSTPVSHGVDNGVMLNGIDTGFIQLNRQLSNSGWPKQGIIDCLYQKPGIGELSLFLPMLQRLSQDAAKKQQFIAWVAPPFRLNSVALQQSGIHLSTLLMIQPKTDKESLWSIEQCLKSKACSAVICWPPQKQPYSIWRRLQFSAKQGDTLGVLFHPIAASQRPSAAPLRLTLKSSRHHTNSVTVDIIKQPGKWFSEPISIPLRSHNHATQQPLLKL